MQQLVLLNVTYSTVVFYANTCSHSPAVYHTLGLHAHTLGNYGNWTIEELVMYPSKQL